MCPETVWYRLDHSPAWLAVSPASEAHTTHTLYSLLDGDLAHISTLDRRERRTRDAIFDAFARLFARENYADITVLQLIHEAHIGRSTFYDHYSSKEDLLDDLCAETFRHISTPTQHTAQDHGFIQHQGDLFAAFTHLLFHLKEDNTRLRGLLTGQSAGLFLRKIEPYLGELVRNYLPHDMVDENGNTPRSFVVNHIVGSFNTAVKWWIVHDFQPSPQTVTGYLAAMLPTMPFDETGIDDQGTR